MLRSTQKTYAILLRRWCAWPSTEFLWLVLFINLSTSWPPGDGLDLTTDLSKRFRGVKCIFSDKLFLPPPQKGCMFKKFRIKFADELLYINDFRGKKVNYWVNIWKRMKKTAFSCPIFFFFQIFRNHFCKITPSEVI